MVVDQAGAGAGGGTEEFVNDALVARQLAPTGLVVNGAFHIGSLHKTVPV